MVDVGVVGVTYPPIRLCRDQDRAARLPAPATARDDRDCDPKYVSATRTKWPPGPTAAAQHPCRGDPDALRRPTDAAPAHSPADRPVATVDSSPSIGSVHDQRFRCRPPATWPHRRFPASDRRTAPAIPCPVVIPYDVGCCSDYLRLGVRVCVRPLAAQRGIVAVATAALTPGRRAARLATDIDSVYIGAIHWVKASARRTIGEGVSSARNGNSRPPARVPHARL